MLARQFAQHLVENRRAQLGGAAAGFDRLGQPDAFDVRHGRHCRRNCRLGVEHGRACPASIRGLRQLLRRHFRHPQLGILMIPVGGDVLEGEAEGFALAGEQWGEIEV